MKVIFLHELFGGHYDSNMDPFIVVHVGVEVEIFHIHVHVPENCCVDDAVPVDFCCVDIHSRCCDSAWIIYQVSS